MPAYTTDGIRSHAAAARPAWRVWLKVCLAAALCWVALSVAAPGRAMAAPEEDEVPDARLEGFATPPKTPAERPEDVLVAIPKSGTATTWMLFLVMVVIACGALFKNAKRSHLD